jgi:Flp pilus assembly protein TadB
MTGMRNKLLLIIAVVVAGIAGVAALTLWSRTREERAERDRRAIEAEIQDKTVRLRAQLLQEKVRYVRTIFGDVDARTYELCHISAPTVDANKKKCANLDARVEAAQKKQAKW